MGHQESGFTLIELLVVLAIVGLLMIAMVPTSVQIGAGIDVRTAASEIAANLRTARARALRSNSSTAVLFETAKSVYWLEGSNDVEMLPEGTTLQIFTVREERWTGSVGAIRFSHDGTSSGGRVTIARDNRSYDVSVNWLTGRVSIDAR